VCSGAVKSERGLNALRLGSRYPLHMQAMHIAIVCDALKIAYVTQGRAQYRDVFLLIRGRRKFLNLQIRLGGTLGFPSLRPCLRMLKSYWPEEGGLAECR
jgi:hypothetical protein